MHGNKLTTTSWIILGICFALMFIGMFFIGSDNIDAGVCVLVIGCVGALLYLLWLVAKSILASKNAKRTALIALGCTLGVGSFTFLGVVLSLVFDIPPFISLIILLLILGIVVLIKRAIDNTACPKCGKKFSMKEINRKIVAEYATTKDVEQKIRNKKGEVTGTYTQTVPATTYIFDCIDECKFCGHRREVQRSATYRD